MPLSIGICLGDVTGIGPEVSLKALLTLPPEILSQCVIIGDVPTARRVAGHNQLPLKFHPCTPEHLQAPAGYVPVLQPDPQPLAPGLPAGAAPAALAAVRWLETAAHACLRGQLKAMVTAPVNKHAINQAGYRFIGQTEMVSGIARASRTAMMLLGPDDRGRWLRVVLATTHVSIRKVPDALTTAKVELAIDLAHQACLDLRLPRARIAVCGLNPHAGENGQMGDEEPTTIAPAVSAARSRGIDAIGPLSADALFYYAMRGDYDAVVAMYHDQGLAPLKMACFEQGVNWTLGLPFIRTSPDHGTAYDIAGKGLANPSSMVAAIRLAYQLSQPR